MKKIFVYLLIFNFLTPYFVFATEKIAYTNYPKNYKFTAHMISVKELIKVNPVTVKFTIAELDGTKISRFEGDLILNCETLSIHNLGNEYINYPLESNLGSYMREVCSDTGMIGAKTYKNLTPSASSSYRNSTQTSSGSYEAQANEYFHEQQIIYDQQMALYEKQKSEYEDQQAQIEKEKEKQKGLKMLELGLRMAGGQSIRDASMATAGMQPLPSPVPPSMRLQETYRITTPNGGTVNCRYDPNLRSATCY